MAVIRPRFNTAAFIEAMDAVRKSRGVSWREVARAAVVNTTTVSRMINQKRMPSGASLVLLADWAGLNPARFVVKGTD